MVFNFGFTLESPGVHLNNTVTCFSFPIFDLMSLGWRGGIKIYIFLKLNLQVHANTWPDLSSTALGHILLWRLRLVPRSPQTTAAAVGTRAPK